MNITIVKDKPFSLGNNIKIYFLSYLTQANLAQKPLREQLVDIQAFYGLFQ